MANDTLKYSGGLLLFSQNLLMECCCTPGGVYWEAVPCDAVTIPTQRCWDVTDCAIENRKFVNTQTRCLGDPNYVCECQQFLIYNFFQYIQENTPFDTVGKVDALSATLASNFTSGTLQFSDDGITITVASSGSIYGTSLPYEAYTTLDNIISGVNNTVLNGGIPFTIANEYCFGDGEPDVFYNTTYNFSIPTGVDVASIPSQFSFEYEGEESVGIIFTKTYNNIRSQIQSRITNMDSWNAGGGVIVYNDNSNSVSADSNTFYIVANGTNCGVAKSNFRIKNRLTLIDPWAGIGSPTSTGVLRMSYGDYAEGYGWGTDLSYIRVPSGTLKCPYEDSSYFSPRENVGYMPFDVDVQCCPQRGCTIGPNQLVPEADAYEGELQFLENTIVSDGECYQVNPFYFMFGKEGRFDDDPRTSFEEVHVVSECNYGSGNNCDNSLPCNCNPELFIASFHYKIPWGPFGSYYYGIECEGHPTNLFYECGNAGDGFLDVNPIYVSPPDGGDYSINPATNRYGYNYAPSGWIKTKGTWLSTTGITIEFSYYAMRNFYVGTGNFDDRIYGKIDATTVSGGLTIVSGNLGTGPIVLQYNTSGRMVSDFVDAINNIRTYTTGSADTSCQVFSFCKASEDVAGIPADKINNLSAECFDVWQRVGNTQGASDPAVDTDLFSGSDIFVSPKKYNYDTTYGMFAAFGSGPKRYNTTLLSQSIRLPPPCRRKDTLPYETGSFNLTPEKRPWWCAMQGCTNDVLEITKGGSVDPNISTLNIQSSGRSVVINAYSGVSLVTGIIVSSLSTSGNSTVYSMMNNLNAVQFKNVANTGLYNPVIATGLMPYTVWLDDNTYWDGVAPTGRGFGTATPHNWSYTEPLLNSSIVNLLQVDSTNLQCYTRRRCNYVDFAGSEIINEVELNKCVPPAAHRIESNTNCTGDNVYESNWLALYGCTSTVCKTEWYIKARRCGCTDTVVCAPEGPTLGDNEYVTDEVTYPDLYICQQNIHPDCDIPFLIKVPYQFVFTGESEYWEDQTCPRLGGAVDLRAVKYSLPDYYPGVPFYTTCPGTYMCADEFGWCQYIDPEDVDLVRKEDIPRAFPPVALVMERSSVPFCSVNYEAVGDCLDVCDSIWDRLANLTPWVPPEYIIPPDDASCPGIPCHVGYSGVCRNIFAFIRAAAGPDTSCERDDIDCNTRCCDCYFVGRPSGAVCCPDVGPKRNCIRTDTYDRTYTSTNNELSCCYTDNGCCTVGGGGCPGGGNCQVTSYYGGSLDIEMIETATRQVSAECGCFNELGTVEYTYTSSPASCGAGYSSACGSCCGNPCLAPLKETYGCETWRALGSCGSVSTGCCGDGLSISCGGVAARNFGNPSLAVQCNVDSYSNYCCDYGLNVCGVGTITRESIDTFVFEGTSPFDSATLGCILGGCAVLGLDRPDGTSVITSDEIETVGEWNCDTCNFSTGGIKTREYIDAWRWSWECGLANRLSSRASG